MNGNRLALVGHIAMIAIFLSLAIIALIEKNMATFIIWITLLILFIIFPIILLRLIPILRKKEIAVQKPARIIRKKKPTKILPKKKSLLSKMLKYFFVKKKGEPVILKPKEEPDASKEEPIEVIKIEPVKIEPIPGEIPKKEKAVTSTQIVKTDFDRLIEYASQEKEVSIIDAAKHFKIPKEKIEEWAKILSEHNLLEITYPAFGEARIRAKGAKKE